MGVESSQEMKASKSCDSSFTGGLGSLEGF